MRWGPWRGGASHVFVWGHLRYGVLDVGPYLCSYGYASQAASSADASARHMRPRGWARFIRVRRCLYLVFIAF